MNAPSVGALGSGCILLAAFQHLGNILVGFWQAISASGSSRATFCQHSRSILRSVSRALSASILQASPRHSASILAAPGQHSDSLLQSFCSHSTRLLTGMLVCNVTIYCVTALLAQTGAMQTYTQICARVYSACSSVFGGGMFTKFNVFHYQ